MQDVDHQQYDMMRPEAKASGPSVEAPLGDLGLAPALSAAAASSGRFAGI